MLPAYKLVDWPQRLEPPFSCSDDLIGTGAPYEGFGVGSVVRVDKVDLSWFSSGPGAHLGSFPFKGQANLQERRRIKQKTVNGAVKTGQLGAYKTSH